MLRALVYDTSIGGLMIRLGRASNQWLYSHWSPLPWPTVLEEGWLLCLTLIHSWKRECLDSFCSSTSALIG